MSPTDFVGGDNKIYLFYNIIIRWLYCYSLYLILQRCFIFWRESVILIYVWLLLAVQMRLFVSSLLRVPICKMEAINSLFISTNPSAIMLYDCWVIGGMVHSVSAGFHCSHSTTSTDELYIQTQNYWQRATHVHLLTHWSRGKTAAIFQTTFSYGFFLTNMYEFRLTFH